ncbi:hypothetical protein [Streptomyces sp. NPDC093600]|uniref:hypothetical protein n=1 Tax=Streptomyces sp. NPDC093600 TaxID=3366047 RepID=UPI0037F18721
MTAPLPARPAEHPLLPAEFDEQLRQRLAELDAASDNHAADQRPDNTTRSYASDWKTWTAFCEQLQIPPTAATRGTLRAFVDYLWNREQRAYSTIDRKLAGVSVTLRQEYGVVINKRDTKSARELLKDYRLKAEENEEPTRGRGKAPAMRVDALRQIVEKCSDDIFGVRDRAMLLLGFSVAARRAELAGLRLRNISAPWEPREPSSPRRFRTKTPRASPTAESQRTSATAPRVGRPPADARSSRPETSHRG